MRIVQSATLLLPLCFMSNKAEEPTLFHPELRPAAFACGIDFMKFDDRITPKATCSWLRKFYACSASEHEHFSPDEFSLIIDSAASLSITNNKNDFAGPIKTVLDTTINGIASGLSIEGYGKVIYTILDDDDAPFQITLDDVLYVPKCPVRLLCPQQVAAASGNQHRFFTLYGDNVIMNYDGHRKTIQYHSVNNLPMLTTAPGFNNYDAFCTFIDNNDVNNDKVIDDNFSLFTTLQAYKNTTSTKVESNTAKRRRILKGKRAIHTGTQISDTDNNLSKLQEEFLFLHCERNHVNFCLMQDWAKRGIIAKKFAKCEPPRCKACLFAKAQRRAAGKSQIDARTCDKPGAGVSVDEMDGGAPGLMPTSRGKPTKRCYKYCSIWVDHFSRFVYGHMQEEKSTKQAIEGKNAFEQFSRKFDVNIRHIHADNGVFANASFIQDCDTKHQTHSFSGVGAHWMNAISERYIGVISTMARTLLLHAKSILV